MIDLDNKSIFSKKNRNALMHLLKVDPDVQACIGILKISEEDLIKLWVKKFKANAIGTAKEKHSIATASLDHSVEHVSYESICKNKSYWVGFNANQLSTYADKIVAYYREHGFPYSPADEESRNKDLTRFLNAKYNDSIKIVGNDVCFTQNISGLAFLWSFFPWYVSIKCQGKSSSLMDAFLDDEKFKSAILKRLKYGGDYISDGGVRKALKLYGAQTVSNFRPLSARAIYSYFLKDKQDATVLDPCSGFAGRALGAFACENVGTYIGVDPNTKLISGYNELLDFLHNPSKLLFNCSTFEDFDISELINRVDLVFTSPPYFDTEHYADEPTQSFIRYPDKDSWRNKFLFKLIEKSYTVLKPGCNFILNIEDVAHYKNLVEDAIFIAKKLGFECSGEKNYKYCISDVNKGGNLKFEHLLVFTKSYNFNIEKSK